RAGNAMNQDGDNDFGEIPDDEYTAHFSILGSLHFDSTDVPAPVLGFSAVGSYLDVDQDVTIGDLNVTLNISHADVSELLVLLVSPSGTGVYLSFLDGGPGPGFVDTTFDDEASQSISAGTSPFTGSYRPDDPLDQVDNPLALFDG